jgi:hypothetical protein
VVSAAGFAGEHAPYWVPPTKSAPVRDYFVKHGLL